jgi:hypothetical protein
MIENGSLSCVFCGSARVVLLEVDEAEGGKEGLRPEVSVFIACRNCRHQFTLWIMQANKPDGPEEVTIGLSKLPCPEACTMQAMHQEK